MATGAGWWLCHSLRLPGAQESPRGRPGDLILPNLHIAPGPGPGIRHGELCILKVCHIISVLGGQSQQLRDIEPCPKATLAGDEGGPCPRAFLPPAARFLAAAPLRLDNWVGRDRPGALGGGLGGWLRPEA